ncbi:MULTISPECIES: universal stress protein [Rhizobium]|uniref:Nucleotide-binding universal stress UspA family protein n=1 Tax=Rhizobium paranaense TaxID=1650438 RepID=A0A7W8XUQ5_9HYPH|nr:universal stress protein [Rhizobium paranaense]MBB5575935.1 nucleotide-binding universal stress UspA family protein [Rhizobium paranaense]
MTFRSILTHFDIDAAPEKRATFALALADRFDAELLCTSAASPILLQETGLGFFSITDTLREEIKAIDARQRDLHERIMQNAPFRNHLEWRAMIADPTSFVTEQARCADLIILYHCDKGQACDYRRTIDPGTILLTAGRPVLFPSMSMTPLKAQIIVVAWKDTKEARRAVADAMPLLKRAHEVVVLAIPERETDQPYDLGDVVHYLAQHGVQGRCVVEPRQPRDIGTTIADIASEVGADLIVAGGYGHSRFREWIFGGITRSLLRNSSINLFLSN